MALHYAVLFFISTSIASPISSRAPLSKRSASPSKIGTGFGIALALILFTVLIFYLGVIYGRNGLRSRWRATKDTQFNSSSVTATHPTRGRSHIHRKLQTSMIGFPQHNEKVMDADYFDTNTAISPIEQAGQEARPVELSPVEARPRLIELSPIEAYGTPIVLEQLPNETTLVEAGGGTPRRGRFDVTKSWFSTSSRKSRQRSLARDKEASIYEMPATPSSTCHQGVPTLPPLPPAYTEKGRQKSRDDESVDWSGIEFMKGMYSQRKSLFKGSDAGKE
ncbi:hypothetical protein BU24DRAFT_266943 [Aaosphaeria arxii CBS 175.79]|uniref:Uncharacterized protein n=1 Tax=Aaosphaeria arxii CBS 175.79 TaxID=1450172 RepID=A0A6A5XG94_9PLEO|nr:uncharacterized protein BU24DRAFT_266943 [Aaosphaeria arxii CBS 175.79]KAF2011950.1 hypothetical protein BU24DRAFT_266943 [Aaosphaeria arxii CBS 175.79]